MRSATPPINAPRRSRISAAALFVKVMASTWLGHAPNWVRIHAMRLVSTRVFPDPAPAPISRAGPRYCTAWACCSFRSPMSSWGGRAMKSTSCGNACPFSTSRIRLSVVPQSMFNTTPWPTRMRMVIWAAYAMRHTDAMSWRVSRSEQQSKGSTCRNLKNVFENRA